jgi:hypothetical protein
MISSWSTLKTFVLSVLLIAGFSATIAAPSVALAKGPSQKYFWAIDEDARHVFIGKLPVPAELQMKGNCYRLTYDEKGVVTKIEYFRGGRLSNDPATGVAQITIEFVDGFEKRIGKNIWGRPLQSKQGFYSSRVKMDPSTHKGTMFLYDEFGNLTADEDGVAQYKWELDDKGNVIKELLFDTRGARLEDKTGQYEVRYKADAEHHVIERAIYSKEGELRADDDGVAIRRTTYDANGMRTEVRVFGPDEQLVGYQNAAIIQFTWNKGGARTELRVMDNHKKILRITQDTFDERGNRLTRHIYKAENVPMAPGVASLQYKYDELNNNTWVASYDSVGKFVDDEDGTTETYWSYDAKGFELEERFKKSDGKIGVDNSVGFAIKKVTRDHEENATEERYFDENEKLMITVNGYAVRKAKYNPDHDLLEVTYYDVDERPLNTPPYGVAKSTWKYDESGLSTDATFYNTKDEVVAITDSTKENFMRGMATASNTSTEGSFKSGEGQYAVDYDPRVWQVTKELSDQADLGLMHFSSEAFALIFHRKSSETVADAMKTFVDGLKKNSSNVTVLTDEKRTVHNHEVQFAQVEADSKSQTFIYLTYFVKTRRGIVMISTGSTKETFKTHESDMLALLNAVSYSD